MFKNAVIAVLISTIWHMSMCEFNWITFISFALVLFFAVLAIEDAICNYKRRLVFKRRIQKKLDEIKITQQPAKHHRDILNNMTMLFICLFYRILRHLSR